MGLPRDLVDLEAQLRAVPGLDIFASKRELETNPQIQAVLKAFSSVPRSELNTLALCLQALRIQHEELRPQLLDAELVATIPADSPGIARPTERVVREMLSTSTREVIILGYEFTSQEMVDVLADASKRGVEIIMILDRTRGAVERILDNWPKGSPAPFLYKDKERPGAGPYASMHAKCLLVDGKNLLITSANFTLHGMRENIEIGVRLAGWPAIEARKVFSYLVQNGLVAKCN
jgi:phosphatidylserine/phosphatidylglycerophosphate/cardiolipin synthase-like enzyme